MTGIFAQSRAVDQRLRVFDAKAHRERLGFHEHATAVQHAEGVAGTVAQRQNHMPRLELFAAVQLHAQQLAVLDHHVGHALLEAHFAAQRFDLMAHVLDHARQAERADMRLADIEDFFRGAGFHEFVQHFAADEFRVFDLAVKLAVGKGPGTALAELYVGLGAEDVLRHSAQVSLVRWRTSVPRSRMIGLKPICASSSPAKIPQGPKPTTIGRSVSPSGACPTTL